MRGILRRSAVIFALSVSGAVGVAGLGAQVGSTQLACMKIRPYSSSAMTPAAIARSQAHTASHVVGTSRTFVLWHFADGTFALRSPSNDLPGALALLSF
ncbi:MAG: hypothetical protein ACP5PJ_03985 [Acidimicrobiales bacterium]